MMRSNTGTIARACVLACAAAAAALTGCASGQRAPAYVGSEPGRISDAVLLVSEAQRLEDRGRVDDAINKYREAIQTYREFPAAWNNLGVLLMAEGRLLEAAECFAVASDQAPQDPRPPYNLGLTWDRAGYPADAAEHYTRALRRDGRYLPALRGLIRAERLSGKGDASTLLHLRTALLLEQDPEWRNWMELQRLRLETELADASQRPGGVR